MTWSIITGGGIDYGSGPYTVVFPAGQTRVVVNIPVTDDDYFECDEIFMITINSSSLLSHVTPISPSQATVTIWDDNCKDGCLLLQ